MSFTDNYLELRKKKKKQEESLGKAPSNIAPLYVNKTAALYVDNDIAPVKTTTKKAEGKEEKEEKRTWFNKGAFEDGYQFGDVAKTILGTTKDVRENLYEGVVGIAEKTVDAGAYVAGGVGGLLGADEFKDRTRDFIKRDLINEEKVAKTMDNITGGIPSIILNGKNTDDISVLGEKSDSLVQSGGQLAGTIGLQAVGVPWYVTTGVTSFGGEVEGAFHEDASYGEAGLSAAISAGAEILSEKISGGISFGGKTLDDVVTKRIARNISSKAVRTLSKLGVDMAGEGAEEVLSGAMSAIGQKITYADDKELTELFSKEDAWESFIGGAVLGGGSSGINAIKAKGQGVDHASGLTENEQKVVDQVFKDRVAEAEENGKITEKQKDKIYDEVLNDMEKGYISTDTIESVLGGETYKTYKDTIDSEDALSKEFEELGNKTNATLAEQSRYNELKTKLDEIKQNSQRNQLKSQLGSEVMSLVQGDRLIESYNEQGQRSKAFEADVTKYDVKQQETIKKAVDSGILNNTRRTHEFVDMIAKITADKGVLFDFTNNAKLKDSGFAVDGKTVNGYVTKDGVTLNIDSAKSMNSVVGHEITHVLEGTELYTELQNILKTYAESKGEYQSRYDALSKLYEGVEGANVDAELTADLVGDYLFTDSDFINNLSTNHRNVFQKVYDEIKYLCKVATAGSKEARELEKVRRAFEKAYKEGGKTKPTDNNEVRFSMSESVEETKDLVALHNLSEQKLLKSLQLGGLPMPSIAIAKAKDGHSEFGEISLVLPKDVIDPNTSRKNKLYSGDAWTPTYPRVEYKVDDKVRKNISNKIASLVPETIRDGLGGLHLDSDNMNDTLNRYGGDMVEAFGRNDVMKYAYLVDTGSDFSLPMKEANLAYYGRVSNDAVRYFSGKLVNGLQTVELYQNMGASALMQDDDLKEAVADAQNWDVLRSFEPGSEEYLEYERNPVFRADEVSFSDIDDFLSGSRKLFKNGVQKTVDKQAARELIRGKVNQTEYEAWLNELFTGIVEKEGIRNNKDYFTPSGNRRSFEALHYEHNLENVIKAMRETGEKGIGGFGGGSIFGAATTEFSSIEEMKQSSERLQKMSDEEYQAMREEFSNRFFEIAGGLPKDKSSFMATDDAANTLVEAVVKYKTRSGIANYLRRELNGWATYSEQAVDDLIELVRDIRNMPTGYFEAKPQRAVGFEEVGVFVIPNNIDAKVKQELLNRGYSIAEYDPNVEGDRTKVLNQFEEYKFSLSNGEAPVYGQYNVSGKDIALETVSETEGVQESAPVAENATTMFPDNYAPTAEEEAAYQADRIASIDDADAPPEMEAPYTESQDVTVDDPFENRDWYDIGNRKVKAYMYENPEVKPFFQAEAKVLLGELRDTTKGEKWFNDHLYYESGGEEGWGGTKRYTSDSIATLLDEWRMSYADIEKGLNAIIEDNGAENIAAAKKIEFMLNDRLMNGYQDFWTDHVNPPDQDYLALLNEKQVTEYGKEAFDAFMAQADAYAPIFGESVSHKQVTGQQEIPGKSGTPIAGAEDIAPTHEVKTSKGGEVKGQQALTKEAATKGESQNVAKVLTEEPKVDKKKGRVMESLNRLVFDPGMVFERMSNERGNRELQAKYKAIGRAEAMAQRFMEKHLKPIINTVEQSGKTGQFYEYLYHKHNEDRMSLEDRFNDTPNKAVFGDSVTADISRNAYTKLEQANPEFKQWAEDIYSFNRSLREMLVDGGAITREVADLWETMYPHYVPIRRVGDTGLNVNVPLDTGRTGINAPIKRATGGSRDILPLFDTMGQRTLQTFKAVAKNRFGVELKNMLGTTIENEALGLDEAIESVDHNEGLLQEGKDGKNPTFTVFENGEKVTFEITDEMYEAMQPAGKELSKTYKPLNFLNNLRRGLLTEYNPTFFLTNPIKDTQDVLINSQHPAKTYMNYPKAIAELIGKNGHWYQEYMDNGGEQNTYFDRESNAFTAEKSALRKVVGFPLDKISDINNFLERVPRIAEYIASRKMGRSVDVAMLDASRVTTDFSSGGHLTKYLNRNGATFLNASMQGAVQQVRNIREAKANGLKGWATLAAKFAVAGLPAMLLNHLLWDDDEEYEELSDYVKQNYYIVGKYGDGKFVRIPKGRALAVIQNAFEQMENLVTGNDDVDIAAFGELLISNLAPNNPLDNNIAAPIIQAATNRAWYGDSIVPTRLQDLPDAEQYDETTDSISRWLSEKAGNIGIDISPYKINYVLDQYSGGVGDTFLPMLTPEAERGNNNLAGNMIAPLADKFTTDSVMKNQNVSDFYTTKDELTTNANASDATDEDILMSKYMNSVNSELSELYALKRKVQNSDLPDDRKYEKVRDIQEQITDLAKESLATYQDVYIEDNYAVVGDRHYRLNDGTWTKITDKQLDKQEDVLSDLGISGSDYWSNKSEYDFAHEYPEKYTVAKAVGGYESYKTYNSELYDIKADKDEKGKSIVGSRKDKVADYINSLDIDYGMRLILFKSEYNADDSYNYEIIEYLNGREDISFDEEVTILKELGFEVDSEGNISWD